MGARTVLSLVTEAVWSESFTSISVLSHLSLPALCSSLCVTKTQPEDEATNTVQIRPGDSALETVTLGHLTLRTSTSLTETREIIAVPLQCYDINKMCSVTRHGTPLNSLVMCPKWLITPNLCVYT